MNIVHPDLARAPSRSPILTVETELSGEVRSEPCRLAALRASKLIVVVAIAFGWMAAALLAETFGGLVTVWYSGLDLNAAGSSLWTPIIPGLLLLFLAASQAARAGALRAVWKGAAPAARDNGQQSGSLTHYTLAHDSIEAVEAHQTEAWHFAHVSKPRRSGRFLIWKRANHKMFFLPMLTDDEAREALKKTKEALGANITAGFDLSQAPAEAIYQNISAASAFQALKGLSKKRGTSCPARLGAVYGYLGMVWLVIVPLFIGFQLVAGQTPETGLPLIKNLGLIFVCVAMGLFAVEKRPFLPRLRHLHHYRYGLLRGFDWGPTAVRCDKAAIEIWREGMRLRLHWSAVRAVHNENQLTIIETAEDQLYVVPEVPDVARHLSAYRVSQGMGLWSVSKRPSASKPKARKWWQNRLVQFLFWAVFFVAVSGGLHLAGAKPASAELLRDPNLPAWYNELPQQDREAALQANASVSLPIHDEKIRVEETGYQTVRHSIFVVHDRSSLETFGEIRLPVDPNYERAILHRLRVHRGGSMLDQLSLPFEALRREPGLDAGVVRGDLEYFGQIADLRIGDAVEMIWSTTATTPVFPNHFHFRSEGPRDWGWEQRRTSIDLPTTLHFGLNHTDDFNLQQEQIEDRTILRWSLDKAEEDDRNLRAAADWDVSNDGLQLSTFADWSQIVRGLAGDYQPQPGVLPEDLVRLLDEMQEQSDDPQWLTTQALRLVQTRVRYFSVSIGEGGWIPRSPEDVWLSAYGDCKDKALLLVSMLAHLKIQADVVLVDHDIGPALPRMLPSPFIFDHAIVRVRNPHGDWFVDPTDLLQGGVGRNIPLKDFSWGLPLTDGGTNLVEVTRYLSDEPTWEVLQEYTFADEGPIAAILNVTETWRGVEADNKRWRYDGEDMEGRRKRYEKWYAKRFPGATHPGALILQDDLDANVLKLVQRYALPRAGFEEDGLWDKLKHYGYAIGGELYEFDDDEVLAGQARINAPLNTLHKIVMRNVPAPLTKPSSREFENEFIRFETGGTWNEEEQTWTYQWHLKTKETQLGPGDEAAWREGEDYVDANDWYYINLHRRLFETMMDQPLFMGLNGAQLMVFPTFVLVAMLLLIFLQRGARAEIRAAIAKQNEDDGCPT